MGRYKNAGTIYPYSRLYRIWMNMRNRCNCRNSKAYAKYGGRGIDITPEWNNYDEFESWAVHNGYCDNLTLDRVDNNRGYYPDNCRWATPVQQANNRRSSVFYSYHGKRHTLAEWANIIGMNYKTLTNRIYRGASFEEAITKPIEKRRCRR